MVRHLDACLNVIGLKVMLMWELVEAARYATAHETIFLGLALHLEIYWKGGSGFICRLICKYRAQFQ